MLNAVYLLIGIGLLTAGGEALIRGALGAARLLRISTLLSGLLVVGFGTSMPELVVSFNAALSGQPDIAIGNIVGSNIGNVLLVLGLCAALKPLRVTPLALRRDATTVIAASLLFLLLSGDGVLTRADGAILLAALAAYIVWAYLSDRSNASASAIVHAAEAGEVTVIPRSGAWSVAAVITGLMLMIAGSQILLTGALGIAREVGVSEALIGLTLVAVGTSLPEISISIMATLRGHADVAVGNILGSNIFNVLGILGCATLTTPLAVTGRVMAFDEWVMAGSAALLLVFLLTGRRISRLEGGVLLALYGVYIYASFALFAQPG